MQLLDRARSAAMLDRPVENVKATSREFFSNGPIEAVRTGVQKVWHTNAERVDNLLGTKISGGGPF